MLNVLEISEKLGVSKQSVYRYFNNFHRVLKPHVKVHNGSKHLSEEGFEILRSLTGHVKNEKNDEKTIDENQHRTANADILKGEKVEKTHEDHLLKTLIQQLSEKDEQLKIKDRQINAKDQQIQKLMEQNEQTSKLLENMQVLLKTEQEKTLLLIESDMVDQKDDYKTAVQEEGPEIKKKGFWNIFK